MKAYVKRKDNQAQGESDSCTAVIFKIDVVIDGKGELQEEDPGIYLPLNNDDDNADTILDYQESPVSGENDLKPLILLCAPSDLPGTVTLSWGSNIKLWDTTSKDSEIRTHSYPASQFPRTYYVERYNVSNSLKDTEIKLSYTAPDDTYCGDRVKVTVFDIGIDDLIEQKYIPKPGTGNPSYIIVAHMKPRDAFDGKLYWSWQDPSPANTGNAPTVYFQQYGSWSFVGGSQPYSETNSNGEVVVQYNLYDGPGDDGKVKASSGPGGSGCSDISAKIAVYKIIQSDELWWFDGVDAANYSEEITLTAQGLPSGIFKWDVIAGADKVNFGNGSDTQTATTNSVIVKSTGASSPPSGNDVTIQLAYNGEILGTYLLTVYTHAYCSTGPVSPIDSAYLVYGYKTVYTFTLKDQFNRPIPGLEINEYIGSFTNDYSPCLGLV